MENVKSLGFYSRLFLVPKPHQRWRPVIDLSRLNTFLHVEKFKMETPESQDLPDSRGMGIVDRPIGRLPSHPHPPKLKEIPKVLPQVFQFTSLPFGLATAPQVFTMIVKEVKLMALSRGLRIHQYLEDWLIRSQSLGGPSEHSGSGRPDPVLGVDNKSGKIRTKANSGVFVCGLRIPSKFSPCKTHSREMAQTPGFDPTTQVKTCFDCKMFDVANWVACLNGENGPGGSPSHEALSVSSQGALEISSVAGQPPSLDRNHFCTPRVVAKSRKRDERCRPSYQRPQHPTLYRHLKRRLGRSLRSNLYKGSVVRQGKKATHKCSRVEGGLSVPSKLQGPVSEPNSVGCNGQLNSGSLQQGGTHSVEMCALLWKIRTWWHHYQITLKARHIPGCLNVMANLQVEPSSVNRMVTTSTSVPSDLPKVVHSSCRPICHSSEPQASTVRVSSPRSKCLGHRCSEHKLDGSHCLCLPSDSSPSQGDPKHQAMPLPDHCNSPRLARDTLVLGPSAALNRDPTSTSSVNNSSQTVPQVCVPQQSSTSQPPRLVSRSGQLQEQGFSVEVAERIAAPQRPSTRTIYKSKWALFEKWCRENSVDFSTPSVKQVSDFFMFLYQYLNRRPSTIDGYKIASVDILGPAGHHISQSSDLHRLLSSFHMDRPKSSRNLPKWNLSVVLNELTKSTF